LPICDAIILPLCPLVFGEENHHTNMQAHFVEFNVPVGVVANAKKKGFALLCLDDAKNHFTNDLMRNLKAAIEALGMKVKNLGGNRDDVFI
jgi:hypothetical protein